jgi:hypothetical protein
LATDHPDSAELELREVMGQWSQEGYHVQHFTGLFGQVQIEVYRGQGAAALDRIALQWSALKRSLLLRIQQIRVVFSHIYARAALASAAQGREPRKCLRFAIGTARKLEREKDIVWSKPLGKLLRAGAAAYNRDSATSVQLLKQAIEEFDAVDMRLFAASSRRRLGELLGGDEGRTLIAEADEWMARQGIENPARMAALHAPGFPD